MFLSIYVILLTKLIFTPSKSAYDIATGKELSVKTEAHVKVVLQI